MYALRVSPVSVRERVNEKKSMMKADCKLIHRMVVSQLELRYHPLSRFDCSSLPGQARSGVRRGLLERVSRFARVRQRGEPESLARPRPVFELLGVAPRLGVDVARVDEQSRLELASGVAGLHRKRPVLESIQT